MATSILKLKRELHDPGIGHRTGDGPERSGSKGGRRVRKRSVVPVIEKFSQKAQAQRSLAISYGFEGDCANAATAQTPVYELYLGDKDFYNAGEVADEVGRICIDAGRLDEAYKWYQMGHDAGLREPDIKADRRDLWEFRWEHAQARIAARRGNKAEAQKHVAAAKAMMRRAVTVTLRGPALVPASVAGMGIVAPRAVCSAFA